jgi:hypothetical protein
MGTGKLRVPAGHGGLAAAAAIGLAALAAACGHTPSSLSLASGQTPARAVPTITPSSAPVLGRLTLGTFPATEDGVRALTLCEQWSGLRGQYVYRVQAQTPYQLEQWFSSAAWRTAAQANSRLRRDPAYGNISTAFGLATTGQTAGIWSARLLDNACATVD